MSKEYDEKFFKQLDECRDIDNLIIKGHILTEHSLNHYIEKHSVEKVDESVKFSYSNKIAIAQILGLFKENKSLKKELVLLNKLRNSIAHNLEYDRKIFEEFLSSSKEKVQVDKIHEMPNSAFVYIQSKKILYYEKVGEDFIEKAEEGYHISGGFLKFMLTIIYTCSYIFAASSINQHIRPKEKNNA